MTESKLLSCWKRWSKIEKRFILVVALLMLITILIHSLIMILSEKPKITNICTTRSCILNSAELLEKMDTSIDPCDDFYKFTCGKFLNQAIIPDDKTVISTNSKIKKKIWSQLRSVFEKPISTNDSRHLNLVKNYYKSCMNTSKIENEGFTFFKKTFKKLGGWPTIEPDWKEQNFDWVELEDQFRKMGWQRSFFFSVDIDIDARNSSKYIFSLNQGTFTDKSLNHSRVQAWYRYMVKLSMLFGANKTTAISDVKDAFILAANISKLRSLEYFTNFTAQYNPVTILELQKQNPNLPWLKIIGNLLNTSQKFNPDYVINVLQPSFLHKLDKFLHTVKKRTLANFMFLTILKKSFKYLPAAFQKVPHLDFMKLTGKIKSVPRWETCVTHTTRLTTAVSSIYVNNFFNAKIRPKINEVINDIRDSFLNNLRNVKWMDAQTKEQAILKANNMKAWVGYPDEIMDEEKMAKLYENLTLDGDAYFLKVDFNVSKYSYQALLSQLSKTVMRPDWTFSVASFLINAVYNTDENLFDIYAAILQGYYYDLERPQYMNYGGIGSIIGHEITHGFDNQGRQYDKSGNLVDWWQPQTDESFRNKSQCFVEQYGNISVEELGTNLDGNLSLSENIADNGGFKIAYRSYLKWQKRNKEEPLLPGLPYNQKQMFWISLASNWCVKYTKEYLMNDVLTDVHVPNRFRILVPLSNSEEFARDFNCSLGSKMNPKHKCQLW